MQAPDMYRAAAVRNPVTNIATMLGSTDIPDWYCLYCTRILKPFEIRSTAEYFL